MLYHNQMLDHFINNNKYYQLLIWMHYFNFAASFANLSFESEMKPDS